MRVSADSKDPGYIEPGTRWNVKITLDGAEVRDVVTADSDEGFIVRHARDADGRLRLNGGHFVEERIDGTVTITTT